MLLWCFVRLAAELFVSDFPFPCNTSDFDIPPFGGSQASEVIPGQRILFIFSRIPSLLSLQTASSQVFLDLCDHIIGKLALYHRESLCGTRKVTATGNIRGVRGQGNRREIHDS